MFASVTLSAPKGKRLKAEREDGNEYFIAEEASAALASGVALTP
ncbi:hypothetical protein [Novosphingobium soli]|uniref:Uncharacterized protein n=1 Tax=Novosphingobium soli TaxID=574956 RepID=A0ABV6CX54_9SPHN